MSTCRHHCRDCGAHFTSLEAFDAHRDGPLEDRSIRSRVRDRAHRRTGPRAERACAFPDAAELVEYIGTCKVGDPLTPSVGVTIYGTKRAEAAAGYFKGVYGRETAPVGLKRGAAA